MDKARHIYIFKKRREMKTSYCFRCLSQCFVFFSLLFLHDLYQIAIEWSPIQQLSNIDSHTGATVTEILGICKPKTFRILESVLSQTGKQLSPVESEITQFVSECITDSLTLPSCQAKFLWINMILKLHEGCFPKSVAI